MALHALHPMQNTSKKGHVTSHATLQEHDACNAPKENHVIEHMQVTYQKTPSNPREKDMLKHIDSEIAQMYIRVNKTSPHAEL